MIDEDSMRELWDVSLSGEESESERTRKRPTCYFKMLPACLESDEYDSLVGREHPAESSDRTNIHPISHGREIAVLLKSVDRRCRRKCQN